MLLCVFLHGRGATVWGRRVPIYRGPVGRGRACSENNQIWRYRIKNSRIYNHTDKKCRTISVSEKCHVSNYAVIFSINPSGYFCSDMLCLCLYCCWASMNDHVCIRFFSKSSSPGTLSIVPTFLPFFQIIHTGTGIWTKTFELFYTYWSLFLPVYWDPVTISVAFYDSVGLVFAKPPPLKNISALYALT